MKSEVTMRGDMKRRVSERIENVSKNRKIENVEVSERDVQSKPSVSEVCSKL